MPRFSNDGPAVTEWCERNGEGSSTRDLCAWCAIGMTGEPWPADECERTGEPVGVHCPGAVEHPPYEEGRYWCADCCIRLDAHDDD
jgi:hypothetical protein